MTRWPSGFLHQWIVRQFGAKAIELYAVAIRKGVFARSPGSGMGVAIAPERHNWPVLDDDACAVLAVTDRMCV